MMRNLICVATATAALAFAVPSIAQTMTADQVGVSPMSGTSGTDYVKLAADSDNFEIQSGRIAEMRSKDKAIRAFGKQMVTDHTGTTKSLMAALNNPDRKITPPSMTLSTANQTKIALLKKAPKNSFDQIYVKQQIEAHQAAWSLQKGYAIDGTDPSLKAVASTAVPIVESHLAMLKSMTPSGM